MGTYVSLLSYMVYSLPQAGMLANILLKEWLEKKDILKFHTHQVCLRTNGALFGFALVVDNLRIKYIGKGKYYAMSTSWSLLNRQFILWDNPKLKLCKRVSMHIYAKIRPETAGSVQMENFQTPTVLSFDSVTC